jgi:hypothetical protein
MSGVLASKRSLAVPEEVAALRSLITDREATRLEAASLPTPPDLAALVPGGTLRRGASYAVEGSLSLIMALLAAPSRAGSWCGVVGLPSFGIEAAAGFGVQLERLVLVPTPAEHWLTVTAAFVDVLGVVVVRPARTVSAADAARLGARLRQRGCTLLVAGPWPHASARLGIRANHWTGLGQGFGHLTGREATVTATGLPGPDRSVRMPLAGPPGDVADRSAPVPAAGSVTRLRESG